MSLQITRLTVLWMKCILFWFCIGSSMNIGSQEALCHTDFISFELSHTHLLDFGITQYLFLCLWKLQTNVYIGYTKVCSASAIQIFPFLLIFTNNIPLLLFFVGFSWCEQNSGFWFPSLVMLSIHLHDYPQFNTCIFLCKIYFIVFFFCFWVAWRLANGLLLYFRFFFKALGLIKLLLLPKPWSFIYTLM